MYTYTITNAKREMSLPDNSAYLDVAFDILLDDEKVAERRLSFPLETTAAAVKAELSKYCQMYENDQRLAEEAQERSNAEQAANETISELLAE